MPALAGPVLWVGSDGGGFSCPSLGREAAAARLGIWGVGAGGGRVALGPPCLPTRSPGPAPGFRAACCDGMRDRALACRTGPAVIREMAFERGSGLHGVDRADEKHADVTRVFGSRSTFNPRRGWLSGCSAAAEVLSAVATAGAGCVPFPCAFGRSFRRRCCPVVRWPGPRPRVRPGTQSSGFPWIAWISARG